MTPNAVPAQNDNGELVDFPDRNKKNWTRRAEPKPVRHELKPAGLPQTGSEVLIRPVVIPWDDKRQVPAQHVPVKRFPGPCWATIYQQTQQYQIPAEISAADQYSVALKAWLHDLWMPHEAVQSNTARQEHFNVVAAKKFTVQSWLDVARIPIVDAALRGLALISLGNVQQQDHIVKQGMRIYGGVLKAQQRNFANLDPVRAFKDFQKLTAMTYVILFGLMRTFHALLTNSCRYAPWQNLLDPRVT